MKAFKLVRKLKDKSLAPLFIDKKIRLKTGVWLKAKLCPTKGYTIRQGWHCTTKPYAPHLTMNNRVWIEVEVQNYKQYLRPQNQGGLWILAQEMKVIREL